MENQNANTQVATQQQFTTALSQMSNQFADLVASDFEDRGIPFDTYSKTCTLNAMSSIYQLVKNTDKAEIKELDRSNLRDILGQVASLKLNANAVPRECYFQLRSKKNGNDWVKVVEMGIEGDGNDAMLREFGVDVVKVHPVWLVRDGDLFTYPKHNGITVTPPTWEQHGGEGKILRVVYPVQLSDRIEYLIAEREGVKVNLIAHIRNNMMNKTFGFVTGQNSKGKDRSIYDATFDEKQKINAKKEEILDTARSFATVDEILDCKELHPYISAAWLDTPESMIVRKMRNNAIKKYPKTLNPIAISSLNEMDGTFKEVQAEIEGNANKQEFIEIKPSHSERVVIDAQEVVQGTSEQQETEQPDF